MKKNMFDKVKDLFGRYLPFYLLVFLPLFTGCDDYLNTETQDELSIDRFYQTTEQIEQAMNGLYGTLRPISTYQIRMSEFRSDNTFPDLSGNDNNDKHVATFNGFNLLTDAVVEDCWSDHYKVAAAANMLISKMKGVELLEEDARIQYEAEARFIRALAYFQLVRFFGNIPISTTALTPEEAWNIGQSTEKEVYENLIVPDLQYAVEHLAETAVDYKGKTHPERVGKIAAQALLGKVYLTMAGFPLNQEDKKSAAADMLKEVLDYSAANNDKYWASTIDEWNRMWIHENDNKYFIFELQYITALGQGNPAVPYSAPSMSDPAWCSARLMVGPKMYAEQSFMNHYGETENGEYVDKRAEGTINTYGNYTDEDGNLVDMTSKENIFFVKFFESKKKRAAWGYSDMDADIVTRGYWPQNWPVIRLEDVMLMYAECVGKTLGLPYVNKIRERAGLPALETGISESKFQTAVANERRWELAHEGHRWFDLVRHNTYVETMKNMFYNNKNGELARFAESVTVNSYLYPIPEAQVLARKGLYRQNPGY